jgi:hypothetical protein
VAGPRKENGKSQRFGEGKFSFTPLFCGFALGFIPSPQKKDCKISAFPCAKTLRSLFSKIRSIHYHCLQLLREDLP